MEKNKVLKKTNFRFPNSHQNLMPMKMKMRSRSTITVILIVKVRKKMMLLKKRTLVQWYSMMKVPQVRMIKRRMKQK
jgi:hypothetical protein